MNSNGSALVTNIFAKEFSNHSYMHRLVSYMHDKYINYVVQGLQGQSQISDLVFHWKQAQQKYIIEELKHLQHENEKLNNQIRLLGPNGRFHQENDEIVRLRNENESLVREVQKLRTTPTYTTVSNHQVSVSGIGQSGGVLETTGGGGIRVSGLSQAQLNNQLNNQLLQTSSSNIPVKTQLGEQFTNQLSERLTHRDIIKTEQLLRPATPPAPLQQNPHNTITLQQLKQVQSQQNNLSQNLSLSQNIALQNNNNNLPPTTANSQHAQQSQAVVAAAATAAAVQEFTISSDVLQNLGVYNTVQIDQNSIHPISNSNINTIQISQNQNSQNSQNSQISQNSQNSQNNNGSVNLYQAHQNNSQSNYNNNSHQTSHSHQNSHKIEFTQNHQMSQNISNSHHHNSHHHQTHQQQQQQHQSHHNPTSSHNLHSNHHNNNNSRSSSNRQSQLDASNRNLLPLEPKQNNPITTVHLPIVIQNGNQSSVTIGSHSALQNHMMEGGSHVGGAILLSSQGLDDDDHRLDNRLEERLQQVNGNRKSGGTQRLLVSRNLPGLSPANTTLHSVVEVTPTTDVVEHVYENPAFLEAHHLDDDNSHGPPPPHPNSAPPLPARINSNSIMNSGSTTSTKKKSSSRRRKQSSKDRKRAIHVTSIDNSSAVALGGSGNEEDAKQTCPVCQKRVKYLKPHLAVHMNAGYQECPVCFKRVSRLKEHMLVHQVDRPFKCSTCPATFKAKKYLLRHERSCTGEIPPNFNNSSSSRKHNKEDGQLSDPDQSMNQDNMQDSMEIMQDNSMLDNSMGQENNSMQDNSLQDLQDNSMGNQDNSMQDGGGGGVVTIQRQNLEQNHGHELEGEIDENLGENSPNELHDVYTYSSSQQ